MSAACALAEAGLRVQLVERRGYLGGRASSYPHPGVDEVIDNCQHVLFGCCTNLIGFYRRIGVADRIHWTNEMTMIEPGGALACSGPFRGLPAPLHGLPSCSPRKALHARRQACAGARVSRLHASGAADSTETLGAWLKRNGQTPGALDRFWRLVIASALNADVDEIALPYAAKVIRELFLNSAEAGSMGMSTVPLSELYAGAEQFLARARRRACSQRGVEGAAWDEETSQWTLTTRAGEVADFWCWRFRSRPRRNCLPHHAPGGGRRKLAGRSSARARAHLQRASVVRPRDYRARTCRAARSRDSLDVQQEPAAAGRKRRAAISSWSSAPRGVCGAEREEAIELAVRELAEFFPRVAEAKLEKAALVKECAPPSPCRRESMRRGPAPFRRGRTAFWPATGFRPAGLRRWRAPRAAGILAAEAVCAAIGEPRKILNPT
jgi:hypothetical protein